MTIDEQKIDKSTVVLILTGRLDAANSQQLDAKFREYGEDIAELILDFENLDYISSMGLRVLLKEKKALKSVNRRLTIKNMRDSVREVFEITGLLKPMMQD